MTAAPASVKIPRWTARVFSTLLLLFFGYFILGEGLPSIASQPEGVQLNFFALGLMLAGFVMGWRSDGSAALLIASGCVLWQVSEGHVGLNLFQTPAPIAALYAYCWWATRGRKTFVLLAATGGLAGALAFGLLVCPANVTIAGQIVSATDGQPVANARLALRQRHSGEFDLSDRPNSRSDERGRFRLHVGWYRPGSEIRIAADGYQMLATNLGPRPLGARRLNRDYVLQPDKTNQLNNGGAARRGKCRERPDRGKRDKSTSAFQIIGRQCSSGGRAYGAGAWRGQRRSGSF